MMQHDAVNVRRLAVFQTLDYSESHNVGQNWFLRHAVGQS